LVGELVQRIAGAPFWEVVRKEVCEPLELDGAFIGAGGDEKERAAELLRPSVSSLDFDWIASLLGSASWMRFVSPIDLGSAADALMPPDARELFWHPRLHDVPIPAVNGLFTARSLAKLYAAWAANGKLGNTRLLSERTVRRATRVQVKSRDRVLMFQPDWRLGFHGAFTSRGRPRSAFGHFGFGGSGAWADPRRQLAVAFVKNEIGGGPLGSVPLYRLGGSALGCVDRLDRVARAA
jgi:CubicO group peptidase (beta-lactamase class C family)